MTCKPSLADLWNSSGTAQAAATAPTVAANVLAMIDFANMDVD